MSARRKRDEGMTLIELIVAMGIFAVLLSVLASGVVGLSRSFMESRVDAQTSKALGVAAQRVERSVRYADAINYPGVVATKAYVEWRTDAVSAPSGVTTCTQLRYDASAGTVAIRQWASSASPSTGAWSVILSNVTGTATVAYPFVTVAAGRGVLYQGLSLSLATGLAADTGTTTSVTYYAKNSGVDSPSNAQDASDQSQTPVCSAKTGARS